MNLYDLNQAGYNSLPKMTKAEIENKKDKIYQFLCDNHGKNFLLVCNELKYITMFDTGMPLASGWLISKPMVDTILNIVKDLGTLKAIEIGDSMIEFWVSRDKECHMYAFFNYDKGVVQL